MTQAMTKKKGKRGKLTGEPEGVGGEVGGSRNEGEAYLALDSWSRKRLGGVVMRGRGNPRSPAQATRGRTSRYLRGNQRGEHRGCRRPDLIKGVFE